MWSTEDRERYDRSGLRYPSDLTDAKWALVEGHIPPAKRGRRKRKVDVREVLQGVLCILETDCQWRYLPKGFPPRSAVWDYFDMWSYDGMLDRIHDALYVAMRETEGREVSPTAAIIDNRTAKSAEKGGVTRRKPAMTRARRPRASSSMCLSIRSV